MEDNPEYKKDIFFVEPKFHEIPKNDVPYELRVWAIPDEAREFKDDVIIMIKDNPMPVILPIKCRGATPIVDIIEGEPV
jgi:hydrocephalus-inducing protein